MRSLSCQWAREGPLHHTLINKSRDLYSLTIQAKLSIFWLGGAVTGSAYLYCGLLIVKLNVTTKEFDHATFWYMQCCTIFNLEIISVLQFCRSYSCLNLRKFMVSDFVVQLKLLRLLSGSLDVQNILQIVKYLVLSLFKLRYMMLQSFWNLGLILSAIVCCSCVGISFLYQVYTIFEIAWCEIVNCKYVVATFLTLQDVIFSA